MTLTLSRGPLSKAPPDTVNYRVDGPEHRLYFERFPRRVRTVLAGTTIADTTRGRLLHETGYLPVLYFPESDVRTDLLQPSDHSTACPYKGSASYWTVAVGDRRAENAVWAYPVPLPDAAWLAGYLAFYWDAMDAWFDEDERVEGHLRDPYHRVDVRESSRHLRILANDIVIAATDRPRLLSETGLPNRFYVRPEDVRQDLLEPSEKRTVCPYKGTATYWTLRANGTVIDDVAWSYETPLEDATKVANHLTFVHPGIELEIDGERMAPDSV